LAKKDTSAATDAEIDKALEPKAKTPLIVLIMLVLNLGATGFVAFTIVTTPTPAAQAAERSAADAKAAAEPGPIQAMEPFVVNLNNPEKPSFLKLSINLELDDKKFIKEFEPRKLAIRDAVMTYLAGLKIEDVLGEEAKLTIKQEINKRIIASWGEKKVRTVYLTELVVQ
jgi:flagellar FliL protein